MQPFQLVCNGQFYFSGPFNRFKAVGPCCFLSWNPRSGVIRYLFTPDGDHGNVTALGSHESLKCDNCGPTKRDMQLSGIADPICCEVVL